MRAARVAVLALVLAGGVGGGLLAGVGDGRGTAPAAASSASSTTPDGPVLGPAVGSPPATPAAPVLQPRLAGELVAAGEPVRIRVPRPAVDSLVVPVSGASGVLEPPADATRLGWWREGARPGSAAGSAVLTGHTLHLGGGALDRLKTLEPGDRVVVTTTRGRVRYEVRASWALSKAELAQRAADIFDQDRHGRLVLVTCYDWTGSGYRSNAVVSAVPVASSAS